MQLLLRPASSTCADAAASAAAAAVDNLGAAQPSQRLAGRLYQTHSQAAHSTAHQAPPWLLIADTSPGQGQCWSSCCTPSGLGVACCHMFGCVSCYCAVSRQLGPWAPPSPLSTSPWLTAAVACRCACLARAEGLQHREPVNMLNISSETNTHVDAVRFGTGKNWICLDLDHCNNNKRIATSRQHLFLPSMCLFQVGLGLHPDVAAVGVEIDSLAEHRWESSSQCCLTCSACTPL